MEAKQRAFDVGYVRVRERRPGSWQADYRDPHTGRRNRVTIRAVAEADARRQAKALHEEVASGRFTAEPTGLDEMTVGQALEAAIKASNTRPRSRYQYTYYANRFLLWLGANHSAVTFWRDVRTDIIRGYVAYCAHDAGYRHATIHQMLIPVRMASRFWFENDSDRYKDVARPAKTPKDDSNPLERAQQEARKALPGADFQALLAFAKRHKPEVYAPLILQGMAGLRILEVLNLRECDVDFVGATITVTQTARHTPKNRFSYRVLPVSDFVLSVLREAIAELPVGDREREIFLSSRGTAWGTLRCVTDGYGEACRRLFQRCWREAGLLTLKAYQPRWFRAAFASGALACGADSRVLQAYMGHTRGGGDMLGLHYEIVSLDRMRANVLPAVEKWCHQSGTTEQAASSGTV